MRPDGMIAMLRKVRVPLVRDGEYSSCVQKSTLLLRGKTRAVPVEGQNLSPAESCPYRTARDTMRHFPGWGWSTRGRKKTTLLGAVARLRGAWEPERAPGIRL